MNSPTNRSEEMNSATFEAATRVPGAREPQAGERTADAGAAGSRDQIATLEAFYRGFPTITDAPGEKLPVEEVSTKVR
jgi:hypothetical protein